MNHKVYIERVDFTNKLRTLLLAEDNYNGKLRIQSIEGPGGIGKTSLLEHVLGKINLSQRKYLTLSINGNELSKKWIFSAINHMIENAKCDAQLPKPMRSYFTNLASISAIHNELHAETQAEAAKLKEGKPDPDILEAAFNVATSLGKTINNLSQKSKEYINFEEVEKQKPNIESFLRASKTILKETPSLFERFGIGSRTTQRNAIRENALCPLAGALFKDLSAILSTYDKSENLKPSQSKVKEIDRLLIIIDDYETTKDTLEEFLLNNFFEHLKQATFETVVIILGRDDINNTHSSWDQHFGKFMEPAIKINPLDRSQMDKLVDSLKAITTEDKDRAWNDTRGYPFLVKLWMEELQNGGRNGTSLMRFYKRTTRWMTEEQKKWLNYALLIRKINYESFNRALGNEAEAKRAWEWFKAEGSVRDQDFNVNEYIRSRLEDYLKLDDPAMHRYIKAKVA